MEIIENDGSVKTTKAEVLHKWETDFSNLYNIEENNIHFDDHFKNECVERVKFIERNITYNTYLKYTNHLFLNCVLVASTMITTLSAL